MRVSHKSAAVVINTGDQNGYGVVVNLGRKGVRVYSVDSNPKNITFFSRYATRKLCPDYTISEEKFIQFLIDLGMNLTPKPVLFITSDLHLTVILRCRAKLEAYFSMPYASLSTVEKLVDKILFYQVLDELKVSHAQTYLPKDLSTVQMIAPHLDYPFIIKPVQSARFSKKFGNKCLKINNCKELLERYGEAIKGEDRLIIQKEILGAERYLVYVYMNHESVPLAVCCYKKIRIVPIDYGNAVVCKTAWEPEIIDMCVNVLTALNFSGLAEGEIQRDEIDGKLKLVEINARSTTEVRLAARCGKNMEYIAYMDMLGIAELVEPVNNQEILWIDILGDLRAVFSKDGYLSQGKITISQWLHSLRGKREFAYFNVADPLPFFILLWRFFRTFIFKKERFSDVFSLFKRYMFRWCDFMKK